MNIQQLNQSGQRLSIFVLTALVAVLLTYIVWLCTNQYIGYIQWRKQIGSCLEQGSAWPARGRDYSLGVRVVILLFLLWRGHGWWAWVSKAWIRVLTNERFHTEKPDKVDNRKPFVRDYYQETACDYVCNNIRAQDASFNFFNPRFF